MEKSMIGELLMEYDKDGKLTNAKYLSQVPISDIASLSEEVHKITCNNKEALKTNAEIVLASWFSKVSAIELADREKHKVETEIVSCEEWPNGLIKACILKFFFVTF